LPIPATHEGYVIAVTGPNHGILKDNCQVRRRDVANKVSIRRIEIDTKGRRVRIIRSAIKSQRALTIGRCHRAEQRFVLSARVKIILNGWN
jgi:hypothetical protein